MKIYELSQLIEQEAPIYGINSDGAIWFKPEATEEEKNAARTTMASNIGSLED
jgi:hypothetical protein